jgi:hypothetical protein
MKDSARAAAMSRFRYSTPELMRQPKMKVLVIYDVAIKSNDVPLIPLIINYGMIY